MCDSKWNVEHNCDKPRKMKILAIVAHPADAFDDSGGTLCHHVERGDDVTVVIATRGVRSHSSLFTDERKKPEGERNEALASTSIKQIGEIKAAEVRAAGKVLGITDVRCLDFEDDILLVDEQKIRLVAHLIREVKPDVIITHHPYQNGGLLTTHPTIGRIVLLAFEAAGGRWLRDEELPAHQPSQVYFIGAVCDRFWTVSQIYHPEYVISVDVIDVGERKVKAMSCIRSQSGERSARKTLEAADGWRGMCSAVAYAETFIPMMPQVYRYLPVTQDTLDRKMDWTSRSKRQTETTPAPRDWDI